jgi:hypothetical protein
MLLLAVKCQGIHAEELIKYLRDVKGENSDIIDAWDLKEL